MRCWLEIMSDGLKGKNDIAWQKLFLKHNILDKIESKGIYEIKASTINEFREARLMTKFDHLNNLPDIFKKNKIAILPITRGSYILSRVDAYHFLEKVEDKITKISFPEHIKTIDYKNITSESVAINCVYVSGILDDFLSDGQILPTVNGRMGSGVFSFGIRQTDTGRFLPIDVFNSQVEIDGGFEGENHLTLLEAKNFISDDFLIRQLYYPYRLWSDNIKKPVRNIFMIYSNGIFSLYEYGFLEKLNYNSIFLKRQKNYTLEDVDVLESDVIKILKDVRKIREPELSFPQADSFKRVVNLCELLFEGDKTREEITQNYAFDARQTNYYTDAGRYLGLVDKYKKDDEICFGLTDEGKRALSLDYKNRQLVFVRLILAHSVFRDVLNLFFKEGKLPNKENVVKIMRGANLYNVSAQSTYKRRASTVLGWVRWIIKLF